MPLFEISYKFNPPDDLKIDDLIHKVYVNDIPDNMIKPGDFLPILYSISYKPMKRGMVECVASMPYPLPFSHFERVGDFRFYQAWTDVDTGEMLSGEECLSENDAQQEEVIDKDYLWI